MYADLEVCPFQSAEAIQALQDAMTSTVWLVALLLASLGKHKADSRLRKLWSRSLEEKDGAET